MRCPNSWQSCLSRSVYSGEHARVSGLRHGCEAGKSAADAGRTGLAGDGKDGGGRHTPPGPPHLIAGFPDGAPSLSLSASREASFDGASRARMFLSLSQRFDRIAREQALERRFQCARQIQKFRIRYLSDLRFDARNDVSTNIPAEALAGSRERGLGKPVRIA